MKQNPRNNSGKAPARHFGRMSVQRKKTVIAVCLIAVMALMWARVLARKTPKSAQAASGQKGNSLEPSGSNSQQKLSFRELPVVNGRNDVLTRDFFAADDWRNFLEAEGNLEKVSVVSKDGDEEVAKRIATMLKLQAIWLDKNPQAFINDKLLSVGDKLTVREGTEDYECEVVGINENKVFIGCGNAEITLRLTQVVEKAD